jgi:NACalpha-BTF3-like transcription factor
MKKKLDDAGIKTKKEDIKEVTILFDDGRKLVIKKPIFYVINVRGSLIYQIQIK